MKSKITLLFMFVVLSCFLSSCRAKRQEIQKESIKTASITSNLVSYKDTLLFTPKSETSLKIAVSETAFKDGLNKDFKPKVFSQKNGNATVKIKIVHDTITANCDCDSLAIVAKIKFQLQKEKLTSESDKSDEVKVTKGFTLINVIIAFVLGFVLCFILKLLKII